MYQHHHSRRAHLTQISVISPKSEWGFRGYITSTKMIQRGSRFLFLWFILIIRGWYTYFHGRGAAGGRSGADPKFVIISNLKVISLNG